MEYIISMQIHGADPGICGASFAVHRDTYNILFGYLTGKINLSVDQPEEQDHQEAEKEE